MSAKSYHRPAHDSTSSPRAQTTPLTLRLSKGHPELVEGTVRMQKPPAKSAKKRVPWPALRPYQVEAGRAILRCAVDREGGSISVMMARQAGKNELSAQLEALLLALNARWAVDSIKCAPTFQPQAKISLRRLWTRLQGAGLSPIIAKEDAYIVHLGQARQVFLSADISDPLTPSLSRGHRARSGHDATVLTIARVIYPQSSALLQEPRLEIIEQRAWSGVPHDELLSALANLLGRLWKVRRVVVDATGLGETIARFLAKALGQSVVSPFRFTAETKSHLGYELLAAVNTGRLRMYATDGSPEYREFWREAELTRAAYRPNRTLNFYVDPAKGHDDYLMSLALAVAAARDTGPRTALGRIREDGA